MNETDKIYSGKVRVRACGLLIENNQLLLLKHRGIGKKGFLWAPPGGGVDFQEEAGSCLIREFKEETGLTVQIKRFLFVNEFIDDRFHAIELFFEVKRIAGDVTLGHDPEMSATHQILEDVRWFSSDELNKMDPVTQHNFLYQAENLLNVSELRGFFKFVNISTK